MCDGKAGTATREPPISMLDLAKINRTQDYKELKIITTLFLV
jgi:hypothetical protein